MKDLTFVYFGADRPEAHIPEALLNSAWNQAMLTVFRRALSNQGVLRNRYERRPKKNRRFHLDPARRCRPDRAYRECLSLIQAHPNATLKEYLGAPYALISTSKDEINKDLLAFIKK